MPMNTPNQKPTKDKTLHITLGGLNIASGWTTILGAIQIFPGPAGFVGGGAIQILLFLLTSGSAARHAPGRKWLGIAVFSSLSIYTSSFTYYEMLTASNRTQVAHDQATQAHTQFVSNVYTPIKNQLTTAKSQSNQLTQQKKREILGEDETGLAGNGPKAKSITQKINELDRKIATLSPVVEDLRSKFEYETSGKSPEEILTLDRKALSAVPLNSVPENYKTGLKRGTYLDEDSSIKLLAPYRKFLQGDTAAISSLMISMLIDGLIIVLGTAIEVKRRQAPFEGLAYCLTSLIRGIKSAQALICEEIWEKPSVPFPGPNLGETVGLNEAVQIVTLKLRGKGSAFLTEFYMAIDPISYVIDDAQLANHPNLTFTRGFRMLADELRNPPLDWINVKKENHSCWFVPNKKAYGKLIIWLREEILRQCELEQDLPDDPYDVAERSIKLQLPSRA